MQFVESLTYILLLSAPLAIGGWFVSWFWLMRRKHHFMTVEEREQLNAGRDMNASFRASFLYSDAMRADPLSRRLRALRLVLLLWPFLVIVIASVVFNFVIPQPLGPN